jgi:hypothetical protein
VEAEVAVIPDRDVPVLAGEDRAAAEEHAPAHVDAPVGRPLGVEDHEVVDRDAVAETDLVRVPEHDALAEHHPPSDRAEEKRVEELPQEEAERAGHPGARQDHDLVESQPEQAAAPHHEVLVLAEG